ncbi:MAG: hypothetical protein QME42_01330 [bacterium]|nr:hypothetical protein [bacterium]
MSDTIISGMTFVDFYDLAKTHGNGKPLKRILSLVEKEGCTEVRKSEVEDCEGWNAEWEIQYQFMRTPKTALKFDFYAKNEEYLGFVILRPSYFTVCDSFIRIPTKGTKKIQLFCNLQKFFSGN